MTKRDNDGTTSEDDVPVDRDTHWQHVAQRQYEPDQDGELTAAIVYALATAKDVCPRDLKSPIMYDIIDVAGVEDVVFNSNTNQTVRNGTRSVDFRYTDYLVEVRNDGWIQIYEPAEAEQW